MQNDADAGQEVSRTGLQITEQIGESNWTELDWHSDTLTLTRSLTQSQTTKDDQTVEEEQDDLLAKIEMC